MSQDTFKQHSILWQADGYYGWAEDHIDTDGALMTFRQAHQRASETAQRLLSARKASLANQYQTQARNLQAFHAQHRRAVDASLSAIDNDLSRARSEINSIEATLSAPVQANSPSAHEIRAHLASLPDDKRAELLGDALESGDSETVTSVLAAPAYLSGLNKAQAAHYEHEFRRRSFPDEFARLERLKKAERLATEAGQELVKLSAEVQSHDGRILADAEASEQAARDALGAL